MLTIRSLPGAPLETNCYFVADCATGEAIIIDAPKQVTDELQQWASEMKVTVKAIICTHGHWDHTMGLTEILATFPVPVMIHACDAEMLEKPSFEPFSFPFILTSVTPDKLLQEGDIITIGMHRLSVWNCPGHTPGCICLYDAEEGIIFSGDVLFAGTCGRIDFPGGSAEEMAASLRRLRELPAAVTVYPGHGIATTIGREQPWLAEIDEEMEW